jgi:hypothetical protein
MPFLTVIMLQRAVARRFGDGGNECIDVNLPGCRSE